MVKRTHITIFKIKAVSLLFLLFIQQFAQAQPIDNGNAIKPVPTKIINESEKRKVPATSIVWENLSECNEDGSYLFSIESPTSFSFFGIGWRGEKTLDERNSVKIKYRTRNNETKWSEWQEVEAEPSPKEDPSEFNWSDIIFVDDSLPHNHCEFLLQPTFGQKIISAKIDLVNMKHEGFPFKNREQNQIIKEEECLQPYIITRLEWCGSYADCNEPTYTPSVIEPTHVIIHHGASPDTYTDSYAIVRSYWNYHVYTNGWDDIGYNFLIDKNGNIFQGRHNPNIETDDVKGTHAGNTNGKTIGICFLGNTDVTKATESQLSKLEELLSWWFHSRNFDPTTKASITDQAGSSILYLPRVIGHRDVKSTTCPGEELYRMLPAIRTETKNRMNECASIQPTFDCSIQNTTITPKSVMACESIQISSMHSATGTLSTNEPHPEISFWLSSDTVFNPNYDRFLGEVVDTRPTSEMQANRFSHTLALDSSIETGKYQLFLVTDVENELYETDETNNETSTSISITGLRFNVYASSNSFTIGSVTGEGMFNYNETCTVTASANFGYTFTSWTEDGTIVSTNASYSFDVRKERKLVANFECDSDAKPAPITGETTVCSGQNEVIYSVPKIPNATYTWSLPEGATEMGNSNSISVNYSELAKSGIVSVIIENECFHKTESSLAVNLINAPNPPTIVLSKGVLRSNIATGNQWYWNNKLITGETSQVYIPPVTGSYYAQIASTNCISKPSNTINFDPKTIDNNDSEPFLLFPNPTTGIVEVIFRIPLNSNSTIDLYNAIGNRVFSQANTSSTKYIKIDLTNYEPGIYFIAVQFNNKIHTGKIIKRKD